MNTLPLTPGAAVPIGQSCFSFQTTDDGRIVYFTNMDPFDFHDAEDRGALLLRAARLAESGVRRADLQAAFGLGRSTLQRAVTRLRQEGEAGFQQMRPGRRAGVLVGERQAEATRLLAEGRSGAEVARRLGVDVSTLNYHRRQGRLGAKAPRPGRSASVLVGARQAAANRLLAQGLNGAEVARRLGVKVGTVNANRRQGRIGPASGEALAMTAGNTVEVSDTEDGKTGTESAAAATEAPAASASEVLDRSARDQRDRSAPMGRGAKDCAGRVAASTGTLTAVQPRFPERLSAVASGGVLAALPMLLREGLLKRAAEFLELPKGYYGVTSMLLFLTFLFLGRVRNAEALRHQAPGEWGALLGLDRCPEVKTLRAKVRALAGNAQQVRAWLDALAQDWLADAPEVAATLAVDGHVKVYTGRKGRLPKHFVARQKLCLPATTSYWVNALGGLPLLCLHKDLDPCLTQALEQDILPALERLDVVGPQAVDLTTDTEAEPALTLVFDREGWSPALFRRLARRGVAVLTWHKNFRGADWPEADFRTARLPLHGPGSTRTLEVRLAEQRVRLPQGPEVRQIRRLLDDGRQLALITTNFSLSREQAAGALFSRWSQENFFKYMREEFQLDSLPVHGLADQDPQARVVNPAWRDQDRELRRLRQQLGTLRNRQAALLRGTPTASARQRAEQTRLESEALVARCDEVQRQRRALPRHIAVAELSAEQALDALPSREKLFLDILRMIAYRAETRMMAAVAAAQGQQPRPRPHLKALFQSDADILPEPEQGILRVRILGTASNASDAALAGLLAQLNQTRTCFPGTSLRLVYELPPNPSLNPASGSPSSPRGQDV